MTAYRALRYGKHVELILTDFHSYKLEEPTGRPEANDLDSGDTPFMVPESWMKILDAGREYEANINLTIKHGVKSALAYATSGDLAKPGASSATATN